MDSDFFIGLLSLALIKATPLTFGAMGGMLSERSGVINIGIEGMMLVGAMMAFVGSVVLDNWTGGSLPVWVNLSFGLLVAMLSAGLIAALHAWLSIRYKIDQIISGTVINLLAIGITNFATNAFIDPNPNIVGLGIFPKIKIPLLSEIPFFGRIFFEQRPLVFTMLILVVLLQFAIFHTPWGLRTRAVGEHPLAADTVGINVIRTRYINVILGGMLAGMGGAFLVLESVGRFQKLMTNGSGFIALAALIFGKWTSVGALGSSLLFGFSEALGVRLQLGDVNQLQALILMGGIGVSSLGVIWVILKTVRSTELGRSTTVVATTLASGIALLAIAAFAPLGDVTIPIQFLGLLPFLLTLLILAGFVGRAIPPAAIGKSYEKQ